MRNSGANCVPPSPTPCLPFPSSSPNAMADVDPASEDAPAAEANPRVVARGVALVGLTAPKKQAHAASSAATTAAIATVVVVVVVAATVVVWIATAWPSRRASTCTRWRRSSCCSCAPTAPRQRARRAPPRRRRPPATRRARCSTACGSSGSVWGSLRCVRVLPFLPSRVQACMRRVFARVCPYRINTPRSRGRPCGVRVRVFASVRA